MLLAVRCLLLWIMKKGTENKKELKNGMMTGDSINTNSTEYRKAQAAMFNMIQGQTKEEIFSIEMAALQIRMNIYLILKKT